MPASDIHFAWRDWRWLALVEHHVIFAATDEAAWRRLELEAAVMLAFRSMAGAVVPSVLVVDGVARCQVRERLHGVTGHEIECLVFDERVPAEPASAYTSGCPCSEQGLRLARDLGRALARLHGSTAVSDGRALGLCDVRPSITDEALDETVRASVGDGPVLRALRSARAWLARVPADPVVVHGDPHVHNLIVDPRDGSLRGLIDFDAVGVGHRCWDLRYLHSNGLPFARAALQAYVEQTGIAVDERTVGRFHVVSALDHFAFVPRDAPRFPEIVRWATAAVLALAPEWAE